MSVPLESPAGGGPVPHRSCEKQPADGGPAPQRSCAERPADGGPAPQRSCAERPADGGPAPQRSCVLNFLGHSTVRMELAGTTVLTDPLLTRRLGPLQRIVPPLPPTAWSGVDLVLISHLHNDHLHLRSLRLLGRSTPIVVPRGAGRWLTRHGFTAVEELAPGQSLTSGGLTVTATPADHAAHRWGPRLTHGPHAPAVGHLVSGGGTTVYAAGDTDLFPGMTDLGADGIDVALLPVWGWGPSLGPGHLDPAGAAQAVQLLRPDVVVPVHWGTFAVAGLTSLPTPWRARMRALLVDPPRRFAAAVAAAGSATKVALTAPGALVPLPGPLRSPVAGEGTG